MATQRTASAATLTDLLFDRPDLGLCLVAPDGTVLRANAEWLRSTGYALDDVLGADVVALFPETHDMALALHARARAGRHVEVPRHVQRIEGRETWWEGSIDPVPMEGGVGLLISAREVSGAVARERAEVELRESEDRYRCLFENLNTAVILAEPLFDRDGRLVDLKYLMANPAASKHLNKAPSELVGRRYSEIFHHPGRNPVFAVYEQVLSTGKPYSGELFLPAIDRTCSIAVFCPSPGRLALAVADISDRAIAENNLRESEARFREVLENSRDCIYRLDARTGRFDYISPAAERITGYSTREMEALDATAALALVHPDDRSGLAETLGHADTTGHAEAEYRLQTKSGGYRWVSNQVAVVRDEAGLPRYRYGTLRDITERKRAGEALQESEERFRVLIQNLQSAVALVDEHGTFLVVNQSFRQLFEIPEDADILNVNSREWAQWQVLDEHGVLLPLDEHPVRRAALTGRAIKNQLVAVRPSTGKPPLWLLVSAEPVLDPRGAVHRLICTYYDITARRAAEEARRRSEQKFVAIYDHAQVAMALIQNPGGTLVEVNDAYERMFGWSRAEAVGRTATELGLVSDPDRRAQMAAEVRERGSVRDFECGYLTRSGEHRIALFSFDLIEIDGEQFQLGTAVDVTERKSAEEAARLANERLREADRRKDEFLGMLSHELRNPLAPIRNAAYILERAEHDSDQAERARRILRRQSEHLTRLVDDLLDVTRITRGKIALQRARISLRDVVLRAAEDIRPTMVERGIAFRVDVPAAEVWAHADATRLNQVAANLLHNASKFTRRGDQVVVSLRPQGSAAEIRVRDTGAGVDPAVLPHIFEAFVQADRTIARSEGGLGLGLALVKGIVELHGGEVCAESAGIGKGSQFVVRLPMELSEAVRTSESASARALKGGRRVLVVDDNKDAAESLADILRMDGHDVDVAHDGATALEKLGSCRPEVVLCDIGLPGMDGYEVARAVRANGGPGVRLVALSGYTQVEDVKRAMEAGFDTHIAKPPDPDELARLLA